MCQFYHEIQTINVVLTVLMLVLLERTLTDAGRALDASVKITLKLSLEQKKKKSEQHLNYRCDRMSPRGLIMSRQIISHKAGPI